MARSSSRRTPVSARARLQERAGHGLAMTRQAEDRSARTFSCPSALRSPDLGLRPSVSGGLESITALTRALLLAEAGRRVIACERSTIGAGATGNTTAKATALQGTKHIRLSTNVSEERARSYASANVAGIALARRLAATRTGRRRRRRAHLHLRVGQRREERHRGRDRVCRRAGLEVAFVDDASLPFPTTGAVRWDGGPHFHPQRYLIGLARGIERLGGRVHEHSPVTSIDEHGCAVTVMTPTGPCAAHKRSWQCSCRSWTPGASSPKENRPGHTALAATLHRPPRPGLYLSRRDAHTVGAADGPRR